jgi:hypothetical protein
MSGSKYEVRAEHNIHCDIEYVFSGETKRWGSLTCLLREEVHDRPIIQMHELRPPKRGPKRESSAVLRLLRYVVLEFWKMQKPLGKPS